MLNVKPRRCGVGGQAMRQYFLIFKLTLMEYFVYRLNFILWRFRNVIFILSLIFFWRAIYRGQQEVFGYQQEQMLTYIIGISVLRAIIFGSRTADLAGMIKSGELVNKFLIRPWSIIKVFFFRDLAAKLLDIFFGILELFLIIWLLKIPFYWPPAWPSLFLFIASCLLALLLYFFLSFLLSLIAFWVDNVWAPRWLFGVIFLEFMSGAFFPLDVLPSPLLKLIYLTPFPYLLYFPLKIYLAQVGFFGFSKVFLLMFFWLLIVVLLVDKLWKKGLKIYSTYGG